jgi:hypothetical protein
VLQAPEGDARIHGEIVRKHLHNTHRSELTAPQLCSSTDCGAPQSPGLSTLLCVPLCTSMTMTMTMTMTMVVLPLCAGHAADEGREGDLKGAA